MDNSDIQAKYNDYAEKWSQRIRKQSKTQAEGANPVHIYLEKPAMYSLLPDLNGKRVLCIGCGSGEECDYLTSLGAQVIGIDLSDKLIEIAKSSYPNLEFHTMDMENMTLEDNSFDFAYSSYTMHYVKDWRKTLGEVKRLLKKDGAYQFSTHHPIKWSGEKIREKDKKTFLLGYEMFADNQNFKVYGDYLNTRMINDVWFGDFEVTYFHKSLSEILKEIREVGFTLANFVEPSAIDKAKEEYRQFWEVHTKIPHCMIFVLRKE